MRRIFIFLLTAALLPVSVDAQEVAVERLQAILPAGISAQVLERIEEARARELPEDAVVSLALEGVAKGRSAGEILDAVEELGADMSAAREAVSRGGGAPSEGEIEAATAAMRMGVDGDAVSELAGSRPSGRSLAVALLVVGSLVERGLPADDAIVSVRSRLEADATDGELLGAFPEVGQVLGRSLGPDARGSAIERGLAGMQIPVAGVPVSIPGGDPGARPGGL